MAPVAGGGRTRVPGAKDARDAFRPYTKDRFALARLYREAACVVMPGPHETFGLVALEAAASGARVVASESAPSARLAGDIVHTFAPGDPRDLLRAIDRARATDPSSAAAAELADRLAWKQVFAAEFDDLARLL
jgi:alpha-1,6-mannosyltransferase